MSNEAPTGVLPQGFGSPALSLLLWVNAEHCNSPTEAPSSLPSPSKSNFPAECYVFIIMYIYACVQRLVFPLRVSGWENVFLQNQQHDDDDVEPWCGCC